MLSEQIDQDYERIDSAAHAASGSPVGSLSLNEVDPVPDYQRRVCIHGQPGGYMLSRKDDDLAAGILFDAGVYLYALGKVIFKRV